MGRGVPVILRIPLLTLAVADLVILAILLRPWTAIATLPGQGTTGFDPVVCLVAYLGLMFWVSGNQNPWVRGALSSGTLFGIPAGLLLVAHLVLRPQPETAFVVLHLALLVAAGLLWGVAGFRAARAADHFGMGIVAGAWSSMVSALMACAAILLKIDQRFSGPSAPLTWLQQQAFAVGAPARQSLVHSLVAAAGYLLICPLVGGAMGLLCGLAQEKS